MKIALVGPGAMGSLFAALFTRAGHDVHLIDHEPGRARNLAREGILLWEGDHNSRIRVAAHADASSCGPADLVFLLVKAFHTSDAACSIPPLLGPKTPVVTLQNGLGSAEILAEKIEPGRILVGVTAQGATLLGEGQVRHGGNGETVIGPFVKGGAERPEALVPFADAGLAARWTDDVAPAVWKKLSANCGINALTALTAIRNGQVAAFAPAAALAADAVAETVRVARAAGVEIGAEEEMAGWVLEVARATALNRSSMGQDVDRRRPTEVDFLNGAVVRLGEKLGVPVPVNRTLVRLVLTLQSGFPTKHRAS